VPASGVSPDPGVSLTPGVSLYRHRTWCRVYLGTCDMCSGPRASQHPWQARCIPCVAKHPPAPTRAQRKEQLRGYRKRARRLGVAYDPIAPHDVFVRDGWVCGVCSEAIDPDLRYPHLMSASVDHVVPMSRGGGHVWDNVQAAHFMCNSLKSDHDDDDDATITMIETKRSVVIPISTTPQPTHPMPPSLLALAPPPRCQQGDDELPTIA
jgi:5-methylcytosine-specific restriction endonuclease McrA